MDRIKKYSFILLIILSIFLLMGFVNEDPLLNKKELKKLEKAKLLNQEAEGLKNQADSLYLKIEQFEASSYSDSKKIKKLESRAVDLEIQAVILEEEAYLLENSVYDKSKPHLKLEIINSNERVLKLELLEEITEELFSNSEKYNNQNKGTEINNNSNLERKITDQEELINIYIAEENIELQEQTSFYNLTDNGEVVINEKLLNVFKYNVNNRDSVISFKVFHELFYSDTLHVDVMRSAWGNYLGQNISIIDSIKIPAKSNTEEQVLIQDNQLENENINLAKGIIFKVQIAADVVVLSSEKLRTIYKGDKKIVPFEEDEWFKYAVGNFKTYEEANKYREVCGVSDAFVIAFNGDEKMDVLEAKRTLRRLNQSNTSLVISKSK